MPPPDCQQHEKIASNAAIFMTDLQRKRDVIKATICFPISLLTSPHPSLPFIDCQQHEKHRLQRGYLYDRPAAEARRDQSHHLLRVVYQSLPTRGMSACPYIHTRLSYPAPNRHPVPSLAGAQRDQVHKSFVAQGTHACPRVSGGVAGIMSGTMYTLYGLYFTDRPLSTLPPPASGCLVYQSFTMRGMSACPPIFGGPPPLSLSIWMARPTM
jgi:hypothetical protein